MRRAPSRIRNERRFKGLFVTTIPQHTSPRFHLNRLKNISELFSETKEIPNGREPLNTSDPTTHPAHPLARSCTGGLPPHRHAGRKPTNSSPPHTRSCSRCHQHGRPHRWGNLWGIAQTCPWSSWSWIEQLGKTIQEIETLGTLHKRFGETTAKERGPICLAKPRCRSPPLSCHGTWVLEHLHRARPLENAPPDPQQGTGDRCGTACREGAP